MLEIHQDGSGALHRRVHRLHPAHHVPGGDPPEGGQGSNSRWPGQVSQPILYGGTNILSLLESFSVHLKAEPILPYKTLDINH